MIARTKREFLATVPGIPFPAEETSRADLLISVFTFRGLLSHCPEKASKELFINNFVIFSQFLKAAPAQIALFRP